MTRTRIAWAGIEVLARAGGIDQLVPGLVVQRGPGHDRQVGAVGQQLQHRQPQIGFHPPQQRRAGRGGGLPVRPVTEPAVGDQQPVFFQPPEHAPGQGLLAAALPADRAHLRGDLRVRAALTDGHHPHLRERRMLPRACGVAERRSVGGVSELQLDPTMAISRQPRKNAPRVSSPATGCATLPNSSSSGRSPGAVRLVIPPMRNGESSQQPPGQDLGQPAATSS